MPSLLEIDQEIRDSFDELIQEWGNLIPKIDDYAESHETEYERLNAKTYGLVYRVCGNTLAGEKYQNRISDCELRYSTERAVKKIRGILMGLKKNYENGYFVALENRIVANISSDYMGLAEGLLQEGTTGKYDHVPAAVLSGAVLEDSLRRLCDRQSPPIDTNNPKGQPKTLDPLIIDLQKANVFNKLKAAQLRSWAQTRNSAAHARFKEFDRNDVESMLKGVKNFLADYL